jgi:hypothetical protein
MKKLSLFTLARMRSYANLVALLTLMVFTVSGCASQNIRVKKEDGGLVTVTSPLICPGTTYQLLVSQDPSKIRAVEGTAAGDNVRFSGSELDIFDFTQPVTITIIVKKVGEDCPPATRALAGKAFQAKGKTPKSVAGESGTFELSSDQFERL